MNIYDLKNRTISAETEEMFLRKYTNDGDQIGKMRQDAIFSVVWMIERDIKICEANAIYVKI